MVHHYVSGKVKLPVKCFFLEETVLVRRYLRRYQASNERKCTVEGYYYHDAEVAIDEIEVAKDAEIEWADPELFKDDPRWPTACECGYQFVEQDHQHVNHSRLYRRSDTGEITTLAEAPIGAMWYVDYYLELKITEFHAGPDGHCLCVKIPGDKYSHDWVVDSKCSNCTRPNEQHSCWVRHGTVPNITVDKGKKEET